MNPYGLKLVTPPNEEPVDLADAKQHARIESGDEDDLVTALTVSGRKFAENYTRRALVSQTWQMFMDNFPGFKHGFHREPWWDGVRTGAISELRRNSGHSSEQADTIEIPKAPLQSITALSTFAQDDTETVFDAANYIVDETTNKGRLILKFGAVWPSSLRRAKAIKVVFVAGYGTPSDVPDEIKLAIKMLVAHWYETREPVCEGSQSEVPFSVTTLLDDYRVVDL